MPPGWTNPEEEVGPGFPGNISMKKRKRLLIALIKKNFRKAMKSIGLGYLNMNMSMKMMILNADVDDDSDDVDDEGEDLFHGG